MEILIRLENFLAQAQAIQASQGELIISSQIILYG